MQSSFGQRVKLEAGKLLISKRMKNRKTEDVSDGREQSARYLLCCDLLVLNVKNNLLMVNR